MKREHRYSYSGSHAFAGRSSGPGRGAFSDDRLIRYHKTGDPRNAALVSRRESPKYI